MQATGGSMLAVLAVVTAAAGGARAEECGTEADTLCVRSCVYEQPATWDHGFSGDLHIHFETAVDTWNVDVAFDHELQAFQQWTYPYTTSDNRVFSISNNPWDGHHNANTTLTISFNAHYADNITSPMVYSVKLDGEEKCVEP